MVEGNGRPSGRPVIGVTGNAKFWSPSWWCIRLMIFIAGGTARRISVRHSYPVEMLHGLVIGGGDDIHPSLYKAEVMPKASYDPQRDELEQNYILYALQHRLPMLGICRGCQLINVTCGGNLYADIRPMRQLTSNRGTILPHKVLRLERNSFVARAMRRTRTKINSLHHQAVWHIGKSLRPVAWDRDGFIQAIESSDRSPVLGVQWHPEYLIYRSPHRGVFRWLLRCARHQVAART